MKNKIFISILIILAIATHLEWFNPYSILFHSDWTHWTSESVRELYYSWGIWVNYWGQGSVNIQIPFFGFKVIWSLIVSLGGTYDIATKITFFIPIAIGGFLCPYFFARNYFKSYTIGFSLALFYASTTYFLIRQTAHLPIALIYAFTPLIFLLLSKTIQKNTIKNWVYLSLLYSVFIVYEIRITFIITFLLILFFLFHKKERFLSYVPNIGISAITIILLNLYWIIPMVISGGDKISNIANRGLFGGHLFSLPQALSIFESAWTGGLPNESFIPQPILPQFFLIPFIVLFGLLIIRKKSREYWFWIGISLFGIFLSKQSSEPFPDLYNWIYSYVPGFNLFREASKFYLVVSIGYLGLLGFTLSYFKKTPIFYFLSSCIIVVGGINIFPLTNQQIGGVFINKDTTHEEYTFVEQKLKDDIGYSRTLQIFKQSPWFYKSTIHPQITISTLFSEMWNNSIIEKTEYDTILSILKSESFQSILRQNSVGYILIPRNFSGYVNSGTNMYETIGSGDYRNIFDTTFQRYIVSPSFILYRNPSSFPHIFTLGGSFQFQNINPSQNGISARLYKETPLFFLESFHPEWKLYLEPYAPLDCGSWATTYTGTTTPEQVGTGVYTIRPRDTFARIAGSITGVTVEDITELNPRVKEEELWIGQEIVVPIMSRDPVQRVYTPAGSGGQNVPNSSYSSLMRESQYHVTECPSEKTFYAGGELSKLWEKPIFDDTHRVVYDYANGWTIDPEYIRANYPKEYYHENPDGSIDVRMTLYFRPQSYFYLGLIISGATLLVLIGYLGYDMVRTRRKKHLQK